MMLSPQIIAQNSQKQGGGTLFTPFETLKEQIKAHPPCFMPFCAMVEQE